MWLLPTPRAKEAMWLRRLITGLFGSIHKLTELFSDNKSSIALAHDRTKHIDIRYHFIQYIIEEGTIKLMLKCLQLEHY